MSKIFKIVLGVLILLVLLIGFGGNPDNEITVLQSKEEIKEILKKDVIIIDVRTASEYKEKHIKKSINIPYNELKSVKYSKDSNIIVYSKNDSRNHLGALQLKELGYKHIYEMDMEDY